MGYDLYTSIWLWNALITDTLNIGNSVNSKPVVHETMNIYEVESATFESYR